MCTLIVSLTSVHTVCSTDKIWKDSNCNGEGRWMCPFHLVDSLFYFSECEAIPLHFSPHQLLPGLPHHSARRGVHPGAHQGTARWLLLPHIHLQPTGTVGDVLDTQWAHGRGGSSPVLLWAGGGALWTEGAHESGPHQHKRAQLLHLPTTTSTVLGQRYQGLWTCSRWRLWLSCLSSAWGGVQLCLWQSSGVCSSIH